MMLFVLLLLLTDLLTDLRRSKRSRSRLASSDEEDDDEVDFDAKPSMILFISLSSSYIRLFLSLRSRISRIMHSLFVVLVLLLVGVAGQGDEDGAVFVVVDDVVSSSSFY